VSDDCDGCVKGRYGLLEKIVVGCLLVLTVNAVFSWKVALAKNGTDGEQNTIIAVMRTTLNTYVKIAEETKTQDKEQLELLQEMNLALQTHMARTTNQ